MEVLKRALIYGGNIRDRILKRGKILPEKVEQNIKLQIKPEQWHDPEREEFFWILVKYDYCHQEGDHDRRYLVRWLNYIYDTYKNNYKKYSESTCNCETDDCFNCERLDLVDSILSKARLCSELALADSVLSFGEISNILYKPLEEYFC